MAKYKYELLDDDSIEHEGHTLYRIRALVHIETLVGSVGVGERWGLYTG